MFIKLLLIFLFGVGTGYCIYGIKNIKKLNRLIDWLNSEKYLINEHSTTMTDEFEKSHKWELSRNVMINKMKDKISSII